MGFARRKLETENQLYEYAVGALGRRMRSVAELKRLLRQRVEADTEIGQTLVELVIRKLKDQGYLNDAKYAATYSAFRRDNEKFGRRRVATDLKIKGIHSEVLEKAVDSTFCRSRRRKASARIFAAQATEKTCRQETSGASFPTTHARRFRSEDHLRNFAQVGRRGRCPRNPRRRFDRHGFVMLVRPAA